MPSGRIFMPKAGYFSFLPWTIVLAWALLIFILSAQPAEISNGLSKNVTDIMIKVINAVYPLDIETSTDRNWPDTMNHIVRKYAHAMAFLFLAVFILNAFRKNNVKGRTGLVLSFGFSTAYALIDEIHQTFVPGRACELIDLVLDCTGALAGLAVYLLFITLANKGKLAKR